MRAGETRNDYVKLALLYMGHTKSACVLDHVGQEAGRTYLAVPADEAKRAEYRAFYGDGTWVESRLETPSESPEILTDAESSEADGDPGDRQRHSGDSVAGKAAKGRNLSFGRDISWAWQRKGVCVCRN